MNVVFVNLNQESLAIEYLSAALKKAGHNVSLVFDYFESSRLARNTIPEQKYSRIVNRVLANNPGLIAFSVTSDYCKVVFEIAKRLNRTNNKIPIIIGGIHASSSPEPIISEDFVDYVCIGEGDEAIVDLANAIEDSRDTTAIKNIWSKANGKVLRNPPRELINNLDCLPFPDKDLFWKVSKNMIKNYSIFFSKGCINSCSYCCNSVLRELYSGKGEYLRRRSVDNAINELVEARKRYGIKTVFFIDDIFCSNNDALAEFVFKYKKDIDLPFACLLFPSSTVTNENTVDSLKKAGCFYISLGIQCLDQDIRLKVLSRPGNNQEILDAIKIIKLSKIFLNLEFMVGIPNQGESDIVNAIKLCSEYRPEAVAAYWLRYYPGTKINTFTNKEHFSSISTEVLENNEGYSPFSCKGNTFDAQIGKLVNLLLVSNLINKKITQFILKWRLFVFLPSKTSLLLKINTLAGYFLKGRLFSSESRAIIFKNLSIYVEIKMRSFFGLRAQ